MPKATKKYVPQPKKHRIGYADWKIVHRWKQYPGRNCRNMRTPHAGAVNFDKRIMYIRQYRQNPWGKAETIIHESLHAASRQSSEEWVNNTAEQIANILGHYFEIRDRTE